MTGSRHGRSLQTRTTSQLDPSLLHGQPSNKKADGAEASYVRSVQDGAVTARKEEGCLLCWPPETLVPSFLGGGGGVLCVFAVSKQRRPQFESRCWSPPAAHSLGSLLQSLLSGDKGNTIRDTGGGHPPATAHARRTSSLGRRSLISGLLPWDGSLYALHYTAMTRGYTMQLRPLNSSTSGTGRHLHEEDTTSDRLSQQAPWRIASKKLMVAHLLNKFPNSR
jgi:hypothetical protein